MIYLIHHVIGPTKLATIEVEARNRETARARALVENPDIRLAWVSLKDTRERKPRAPKSEAMATFAKQAGYDIIEIPLTTVVNP